MKNESPHSSIDKARIIFQKFIRILLILLMIYFGIGVLACLAVIGVELVTHQISLDVKNISSGMISLILFMFAMFLGSLVYTCHLGQSKLKKLIAKESNLHL